MHRIKIVAAAAYVLLLGTGCSGEESGPQSHNAAVEVPAVERDTPEGSGNYIEELNGSAVSFGEPVEYDDGLRIIVSEPEHFVPSSNVSTGEVAEYVKFTVHLLNGSGEKLSPSDVSLMVASRSGQAGDVFDAKYGISGPPTKTVKPGGKTRWIQAFGLLDQKDVSVVVQAGLDRVPVEFSDDL